MVQCVEVSVVIRASAHLVKRSSAAAPAPPDSLFVGCGKTKQFECHVASSPLVRRQKTYLSIAIVAVVLVLNLLAGPEQARGTQAADTV